MIKLQTLADLLSEGLTNQTIISEGESTTHKYNFNIQADTGEYKPTYRVYNELVYELNGCLTLTDNTVENTSQGGVIAVLSTRLEMAIRIDDEPIEENGESEEVQLFRDIVDNYLQANETFLLYDDEGVLFSVGTEYSFIESGTREIKSKFGDSFTFVVGITYNIVEQGVSSQSFSIKVDNQYIPFSTLTLMRNKTSEPVVLATNALANSVNLVANTNLSISGTTPVTTTAISTTIMKELIIGGVYTHITEVALTALDISQFYLMAISQTTAQAEGAKNMGISFELVETPINYDLSKFPESYKIIEVTLPETSITIGVGSAVQMFSSNAFSYGDRFWSFDSVLLKSYTLTGGGTIQLVFTSAVDITIWSGAVGGTEIEYTVIQEGA